MIARLKRWLALGLVAGVLVGTGSAPAFAAFDPFNGVDCSGDASNTAVCQDKGNTSNPIVGNDGILLKVTNLLAIIAGVVAIVMIVVGGFRYVTAAGDPKAAGDAKNSIIFSLVGLAIIALARTFIAFVISKT